jgi:hypothetical protein
MISIQYKATHPLWGVRKQQSFPFALVEVELTADKVLKMHADFITRSGLPEPLFLYATVEKLVQVTVDLGKGADSSVTISCPPASELSELSGLTVAEARAGLAVRNLLLGMDPEIAGGGRGQ